MSALPAEGLDLRAELVAHRTNLVEQALARTRGDVTEAAKLLRLSPLDLVRMQARLSALPRVPDPDMKQTTSAPPKKPPRLPVTDMPRVSGGVQVISAAVIRRLDAEGWAPRQIADRLGVNDLVVEKVLRIQREKTEVRKCGPLPMPPSMPTGRARAGVTAQPGLLEEPHTHEPCREEPCRYHGRGAVCDRCPARYVTNGFGFPHFPATSGLQRLRVCSGCDTAKGVAEWHWAGIGADGPGCLACRGPT